MIGYKNDVTSSAVRSDEELQNYSVEGKEIPHDFAKEIITVFHSDLFIYNHGWHNDLMLLTTQISTWTPVGNSNHRMYHLKYEKYYLTSCSPRFFQQ